MTLDQQWVRSLWSTEGLESLKTFTVEGVEIDLPVPRTSSFKGRSLDWQRRVLDDVLPDSPNADAAERIPLHILRQLTSPDGVERTYSAALGEGSPFAPLAPIFLFSTRGQSSLPVAFHVVSTWAVDPQTVKSRAYTEHMLLLLLRDAEGRLDEDLLEAFVEQFRIPPESLDLAHRTVIEQLQPGWSKESHRYVPPERAVIRPFVPRAGELLRRDLRTLISASLSNADFFRYTNQLLALHLGLYQPRLAYHLNPAMDLLLRELEGPGSTTAEEVERIERGQDPRHDFTGRFSIRAPAGGDWRPVKAEHRVRRDFAEMEQQLADLHFNLMMLNRVREMARSYLKASWKPEPDENASDIDERVARPSQIVQRLRDDPDFGRFMLRASEVLAVRFIYNQIAKESQESSLEQLVKAPTGLHALRALYHRYNLNTAAKSANTRAYKQGAQVTRNLLSQGEMGLVQSRRGVGPYFEIGAGLLPLLLILAVGVEREKITVSELWGRLSEYGLRLDEEEQARLLARLKSMGLYERFSDAGEASYVRALITPRQEVRS